MNTSINTSTSVTLTLTLALTLTPTPPTAKEEVGSWKQLLFRRRSDYKKGEWSFFETFEQDWSSYFFIWAATRIIL